MRKQHDVSKMDETMMRFMDESANSFYNWLYMEVDSGAKRIEATNDPIDKLIMKHNTIESISAKCRHYIQTLVDELDKKNPG